MNTLIINVLLADIIFVLFMKYLKPYCPLQKIDFLSSPFFFFFEFLMKVFINFYLNKLNDIEFPHLILYMPDSVISDLFKNLIIHFKMHNNVCEIKFSEGFFSLFLQVDNINKCLAFLAGLGVNIEGLCAKGKLGDFVLKVK